jgi:hypothetical protein
MNIKELFCVTDVHFFLNLRFQNWMQIQYLYSNMEIAKVYYKIIHLKSNKKFVLFQQRLMAKKQISILLMPPINVS